MACDVRGGAATYSVNTAAAARRCRHLRAQNLRHCRGGAGRSRGRAAVLGRGALALVPRVVRGAAATCCCNTAAAARRCCRRFGGHL